jgi:quercetin dioxygenase-like cupin family protein
MEETTTEHTEGETTMTDGELIAESFTKTTSQNRSETRNEKNRETIVQATYKRRTNLKNTYAYMGSLMTFLVEGRDTGGQFALVEYRAKPGNEPPPHWHEVEDETFYILEGEMEAYLGDQVLRIGPGETLFIPHGEPHAWYILSPSFRALIMVSPAQLDSYFRQMSQPAETLELNDDAVTYAMSDPQHAIELGAKYGTYFLTPEQTKKAFPKYAGFGVKKVNP